MPNSAFEVEQCALTFALWAIQLLDHFDDQLRIKFKYDCLQAGRAGAGRTKTTQPHTSAAVISVFQLSERPKRAEVIAMFTPTKGSPLMSLLMYLLMPPENFPSVKIVLVVKSSNTSISVRT